MWIFLFTITVALLLAYVLKDMLNEGLAAAIFCIWIVVSFGLVLVRRKRARVIKLFFGVYIAAILLLPYVLMDVFKLHWVIAASIVLLTVSIGVSVGWRRYAIREYHERRARGNVLQTWIDDEGIGSTERGSHPWLAVDRIVETREFMFVSIKQPRKVVFIEKRNIGQREQEVRALLATAHVKRARLL